VSVLDRFGLAARAAIVTGARAASGENSGSGGAAPPTFKTIDSPPTT